MIGTRYQRTRETGVSRIAIGAAACAVMAASASSSFGDVKSLIAGLHTGDEMRYTFNIRCGETSVPRGTTGVGIETVTTESVGMVVRAKADTTALDIVEVAFESYKVSLDFGQGKTEIDLGGPAPDEKAPALARELYDKYHPLLGTVLTLNVSPGSGEITTFHGGEDLLKSPGGSALRRYVDPDLFKGRFGEIFQLKSNSMMPPPGNPWYVQGHVMAFAHVAKCPVWETRVVENMEADVAKITGTTHATGDQGDAAKGAVFVKSVIADTAYKWDTMRGRLVSLKRSESISTSFSRGSVPFDSDLVSTSTLELVAPESKTKPATPASAPPLPPPPSPADAAGGKQAP